MEFKDVLSVINIINVLVVPLLLFSLRYFVSDISNKHGNELRKEFDEKLQKLEYHSTVVNEKIELKLSNIESKIDAFVTSTNNLLNETRMKVASLEGSKAIFEVLTLQVQDNKSEIKKIESSLHQELRDGLIRVHSRLDELLDRDRKS